MSGRLPSFRGTRDLSLGGGGRSGTAGRLPSFKGTRDLSLGVVPSKVGASSAIGAPTSGLGTSKNDSDKKKKFVPNLSVQRKENTGSRSIITNNTDNHSKSSGWKQQQQNSKFEKPRGGRNFIQSSGLFSEGVGSEQDVKKKSWGRAPSGSSERDSKIMERPKMNLNAKYDKVEEEKKLKNLLRDDFIDDLKTGHLVPIQLPMINTGKVFKEESKDSKSDNNTDDILRRTGKKKKNTILDSDDDEDFVDGIIADEDIPKVGIFNKDHEEMKCEPNVKELMTEQKGELLFFQLPDHLPNRKEEKSGKKADVNAKQILQEFPEGYLGKLQIRKSGKAQMWINGTLFDVDIGTQVGFLQELFVIETPKNTDDTAGANNTINTFEKGSMTNLGRVRNRVVTTPAWTDLFSVSNVEQSSSDDDSE